MKCLAVLLLLAFVCIQASKVEQEVKNRKLFESWITEHNKVYSSVDEKVQRYQNFLASIERSQKLQAESEAKGSSAKFGLTKFSDMTPEEFKSKVLMKPRSPSPRPATFTPQVKKTQQLPSQWDWRNTKSGSKVTPVKDQGQCGSCWAFSVTETLESSWILSHNLTGSSMPPLAPQQIVDCDTSDDGCGGGNPPTAYQYIQSAGGLDTQSVYPYTAEDGSCAVKSPTYANLKSWAYATDSGNEDTMKQVLYNQAAYSICLDAANWQDYQSGVMTAWQCAWINQLDHCVQLVGYDMTASTPYWIVRNSWGTSWGINGYIWLEYGANTCGLTEEATYVTTA